MPLYEYECTTCHRRIEKIQKFSDAELTVCSHCGGPLERTITAAAFSFQGGGWYKDGYGSVKPPSSADSSSSSSSDSTDSSSAAPAKPAETSTPTTAAPATATASAPSATKPST